MTIPGGIRLVLPSLDEPLAQMLIAYGFYEPESLRVITDHLPQSGTFVDVGANVGLMTAQVSRFLAPNGNVLAIEASPEIFSRLEQAVSDNHLANVKAIHAAVTDHSQTDIPFYNAPEASFGMGSLAPQFDAEPILVPARSLDDILAEQNVTRVDVMKVDVEGFEAGVFRGAKKLLTGSHPPHIVFECLDWAERRANIPVGESQRILLDFGYTLHRMNGDVLREPLTTGGDNLWAQPPAAHQ